MHGWGPVFPTPVPARALVGNLRPGPLTAPFNDVSAGCAAVIGPSHRGRAARICDGDDAKAESSGPIEVSFG